MRAGVAASTAQTTSAPAETEADGPAGVAFDDAVAQLIDAAYGLSFDSGVTCEWLVSNSAEAECALRAAIRRSAERSAPRVMPDGTVEIDAFISRDQLSEILRQAVLPKLLPEADKPMPALMPNVPYLIATGRGSPSSPDSKPAPVGWRHLSADDRALAGRAAVIDARRRLLDAIGGIRTASGAPVAEGLHQHSGLSRAIEQQLRDIPPTSLAFGEDLVARAKLSLSSQQVRLLLGKAQSAAQVPASRGLRFGTVPDLAAVGLGVPPPREPATANEVSTVLERVGGMLTATAVGQAPPTADPGERIQLATLAARIEAQRRLWLEIEALPIGEDRAVRDILPDHPELISAIDASIIELAVTTRPADAGVEVKIAIPRAAIDRLIRRELGE